MYCVFDYMLKCSSESFMLCMITLIDEYVVSGIIDNNGNIWARIFHYFEGYMAYCIDVNLILVSDYSCRALFLCGRKIEMNRTNASGSKLEKMVSHTNTTHENRVTKKCCSYNGFVLCIVYLCDIEQIVERF